LARRGPGRSAERLWAVEGGAPLGGRNREAERKERTKKESAEREQGVECGRATNVVARRVTHGPASGTGGAGRGLGTVGSMTRCGRGASD